MMTWADSRLAVEGIKAHPFFFGADWDSLRYIAPPFVPALQSITDTSYFPTDDLGNMPDQLESMKSVGSEQDLAFIGYVRPFHDINYVRLNGIQIHIQTTPCRTKPLILSYISLICWSLLSSRVIVPYPWLDIIRMLVAHSPHACTNNILPPSLCMNVSVHTQDNVSVEVAARCNVSCAESRVGIFRKGIGCAGNRTAALLITSAELGVLTTTLNTRMTRRWIISTSRTLWES